MEMLVETLKLSAFLSKNDNMVKSKNFVKK